MKENETAEELMNGFRTYYNFVRPQSLTERHQQRHQNSLN